MVAEHLRPHLARSAKDFKYSQTSTSCGFYLVFYRSAAHSRTCFCLNQGLPYLLIALNWNHCDIHRMLVFFEFCAHGRIFSFPFFPFFPQTCILALVYCQIYPSIFTASLPNCILLSRLYANALSRCLCYPPSIYLLTVCVIYGAH